MRRFAITHCLLFLAFAVACGDDSESSTETASMNERPVTPAAPTEAEAIPSEPAPAPPDLPPLPDSEFVTIAGYRVDRGRDCDGYPATDLEIQEGLCVGLVASKEAGALSEVRRFRPRGIVQDPQHDERFWLVDRGAMRPRRGRLWRLTVGAEGVRAEVMASRLGRPHGIRVGPDGRIYIGEIHRITRFDPQSARPLATELEEVVPEIPTERPGSDRIRLHPMASFVFDAAGDLIVNHGSETDHCDASVGQPRCAEEDRNAAALWRYRRLSEAAARPIRYAREPEVIALGLRNSVAIASHSSGLILQGENGTDFEEVDRPEEELNVIEQGAHYGWPYCYGHSHEDPRWRGASFSCDPDQNERYRAPHMLLPAHGAPLGMLYYAGDLAPLRNTLLIALHGYRSPGHRILGVQVDARGLPQGELREVVAGWDAADTHPRGNPVEFAQARDGSVWFVEDKNGTILRLALDRYAGRREAAEETQVVAREASDAFQAAYDAVFHARCATCHAFFQEAAPLAEAAAIREGWAAREGGPSRIELRTAENAERRMPPVGAPLTEEERALIRAWVDALSR